MEPLPFPDPPLTDGVVALRPWRDEDVAVKVRWGRDEQILRFTGVPRGNTEEQARAHAVSLEEARLAGRAVGLAIVDAGDEEVVLGSCDLRRPDPVEDPALGELGYLLDPAARGRGVGARAVGLVVGWGFAVVGLGRIQALVDPANDRSARLLERLGFRREGLLEAYRPDAADPDRREDRLLYARLSDASRARPTR